MDRENCNNTSPHILTHKNTLSSWFFIFLFSFSLLFSVVWFSRSVDSATPPSIITYQGKLLEDGASVTTTKAMSFTIYDADSGGTALYTAAGTLPTIGTIMITPTAGIFSINLGDTDTNTLDPTIFSDNSELYLEIIVDGTTLSPRKRLTASPYAVNSSYLNGVEATSTPQSTTYIPMSDIDGSFAFNTTTFGGGYAQVGNVTNYYGETMYGFSAGSLGTAMPGGSLQLHGNTSTYIGTYLTLNQMGQNSHEIMLATYGPIFNPYGTALITIGGSQINGALRMSNGLGNEVLAVEALDTGSALNFADETGTTYFFLGDGRNKSRIMDSFKIGANTESIANGSFAVSDDDLYVEGDMGIHGNIFTDGILDVAGTGTSTFAGSIDLASGKCFSVNGTCISGGSSQWTTAGSDIYFSSGNVGINTTSPMYDLAVSGDMFVSATSTLAGGSVKTYVDTSLGTSISTVDSGTGLSGSAGVFRAMSSNPNLGPAVVLYPISTTTIPGMTTGYAATFSVSTSNRPQLTLGGATPSVGAGSIVIGAGGGSLGAYISGSTSEDSYLLNDFLLGAGTEAIASGSFVMNGNDLYVHGDAGFNSNIYADGILDVAGTGTSTFGGNASFVNNTIQLRDLSGIYPDNYVGIDIGEITSGGKLGILNLIGTTENSGQGAGLVGYANNLSYPAFGFTMLTALDGGFVDGWLGSEESGLYGKLYFSNGIDDGGTVTINGLTGLVETQQVSVLGTSTSTFGGSIDIASGCFSIAGVCLSPDGVWTTSGSDIYFDTGVVSIGTYDTAHVSTVMVSGTIRVATTSNSSADSIVLGQDSIVFTGDDILSYPGVQTGEISFDGNNGIGNINFLSEGAAGGNFIFTSQYNDESDLYGGAYFQGAQFLVSNSTSTLYADDIWSLSIDSEKQLVGVGTSTLWGDWASETNPGLVIDGFVYQIGSTSTFISSVLVGASGESIVDGGFLLDGGNDVYIEDQLGVNGRAFFNSEVNFITDVSINGIAVGLGGGGFSTNVTFGGLQSNTTGQYNSAVGIGTLSVNTEGSFNSGFGYGSLSANTLGAYNTAFGANALNQNISSDNNSAFGNSALQVNIGEQNSAFGSEALANNDNGSKNSAFGVRALFNTLNGNKNAAFGSNALEANTSGEYNSAFGDASMVSNETGDYNVGLGYNTLINLVSGSFNTVVGVASGGGIMSGSYNTIIGASVSVSSDVSNNIILADGAGNQRIRVLDTGFVGINTTSPSYLLHTVRTSDGIVAAFTDTDATCTVDPSDGDFSCTSDRNLKTNITVMGSTLDAVMQLNPVTYNWNTDPSGEVNYGFIAQEVEALFPRLVGTGANGYKTLSQIGLIPFLTKAIQEQQDQIDALTVSQGQGGTLDWVGGDLDLGGYSLFDVASISSVSDTWSIDEHGRFVSRVEVVGGETKTLYGVQSEDSDYVLSGSGQLQNGQATILFEDGDKSLIDTNTEMRVSITLTGEANGVYVTDKSADGFVVRELRDGSSSATFDWVVITKRLVGGQVVEDDNSPVQPEGDEPSAVEGAGEEVQNELSEEVVEEVIVETGDEEVVTVPEEVVVPDETPMVTDIVVPEETPPVQDSPTEEPVTE